MIHLIVPCYNEEHRLQSSQLLSLPSAVTLHFVNDGSTDQTASVLASLQKSLPSSDVIELPQNVGKGEAIRQGILHLISNHRLGPEDWVGYWDADLSTPFSEIPKMLKFAELYDEVDAIWGSRVYRLGAHIDRYASRHYLGRVFATLIGELLKVKSYDSQCGAKLFRPATLETAFSESFISRWIFDVEILLRLKNFKLVEFPLTYWKHAPGSKLKVHRELFRVFFDVLRLRTKYL